MSGGAFLGDAQLKLSVLAQVADGGPLIAQWQGKRFDDSDCAAIAAATGLHPALIHLLAALGGDIRDTDIRLLMADTLRAIPVGAASDHLVRRWFLWALHDAPGAITTRLAGTAAALAVAAAAALIETSLTQPVDGARWRRVRQDLTASATGLTLDQQDDAEVVLAMGFDLDTMPAVADDVVTAWQAAIRRATGRANGWTAAEDAQLETLTLTLHDQALATLGDATEANKDELVRRYRAINDTLWAAPEAAALKARDQARRHLADEQRWAWRDAARAALPRCA